MVKIIDYEGGGHRNIVKGKERGGGSSRVLQQVQLLREASKSVRHPTGQGEASESHRMEL